MRYQVAYRIIVKETIYMWTDYEYIKTMYAILSNVKLK